MTFQVISILNNLFFWVLTTSIAATVLVVVVFLVQWMVRGRIPPRGLYWLWLLVVARLLMPVSLESSWSLFNWLPVSGGFDPQGRIAVQPGRLTDENASALPLKLAPIAISSTSTPATPQVTQLQNWDMARPHLEPVWMGIGMTVWLAGVTACLVAVMVQHQRLARRVKREATAREERLVRLLGECIQTLGLRRPIRLVEVDCLPTPAVFGVLRPCLLLPRSVAAQLNAADLRNIFLHELVHVRRHDVLLNWILIIVRALHWFNPAVWFAVRRLWAERELVCDSVVLSHLRPAERSGYGATLIKLLPTLSVRMAVPSLAPVISRHHDIERRITMIAKYKLATRPALIVCAALLVTLTAFTFTRAADKTLVVPPPIAGATGANPASPDLMKDKARRERGLRMLEDEMAKHQEAIQVMQRKLDELKEKLQISDSDEAANQAPGLASDTLRKLEGARIEAAGNHARSVSLLRTLTNQSRGELRRTLPTASPDALLPKLLEQLALTEQKRAELTEKFALDHPDVRVTERVLKQINSQVDERIDGILGGLKVKLSAEEAHLSSLTAEVDAVKRKDIEAAIQRRPFYQLKRDLDSLQFIKERLQIRIWQEKVDAQVAE